MRPRFQRNMPEDEFTRSMTQAGAPPPWWRMGEAVLNTHANSYWHGSHNQFSRHRAGRAPECALWNMPGASKEEVSAGNRREP